MPRLLPKDNEAIHRRQQVVVSVWGLIPLGIGLILAFTWLNSAAILIGVAASLIVFWTVWVTPQPWTVYDRLIFILWPSVLFFYIACMTLFQDTHDQSARLLGIGPVIVLPLLRHFFKDSKRTADRHGLYILLLLPAFAIALLSSSSGGADPMHKALMDWFGLAPQAADIGTIAIRKTIHFTFYGVAGYLAFRYVIASRTVYSLSDRWKKNPPAFKLGLLMALPYVAILAGYDEARQLFSANRTGSVWDFLLDMAGALFFVGVWGKKYLGKAVVG